MKNSFFQILRKRNIIIIATITCIIFLFTKHTFANENSPAFYTIQVSSHQMDDLDKAVEIAIELEKQNLPAVRVELIGKMYTVRVGTYQKEKETKEIFKKIKDKFPDSFVRKGYYLRERIIYPEELKKEKTDTISTTNLSQEQTDKPIVIAKTPEEKSKEAEINKEENKEPVILQLSQNITKETSSTPVIKENDPVVKEKSGEEKKNRIELLFSNSYLSPHDDYGSWNQLSIVYFRKEKGFTYFVQGEIFQRKEGDGGLVGTGIYKDWKKTMYTYTSIAAGNGIDYLPEIRIDQSFNFKLGQKRNIILPINFTYIKSPNNHKDYIFSTGAVVYLSKTVWEYKISRNQSEPGNIISYSNLVSVSWGKEGVQWWHLTCSYGQEAYLADYLIIPEEVRNKSLYIELGLRKWLKENYGIIGNINYLNLKNSYQKYGFILGMFMEF
jgi:YaiO family outer membrane protein